MCIRDRHKTRHVNSELRIPHHFNVIVYDIHHAMNLMEISPCLLYTSDAADERSSVDLGGRRIIKKKTKDKKRRQHDTRSNTTSLT